MRLKVLLIPALLVLLCTAGVVYSATTSVIAGKVVDDTGAYLVGVKVTLSGPNMPGERSLFTDDKGEFRFVEVPPGSDYQIVAETPGMKTTVLKGIIARLNDTTFTTVEMEIGVVTMKLEVIDDAPVMDTTSATTKTTVPREFQERLPGNDSFQDAFSMGGGTVGAGNPKVHGAQETDNTYLFDGIDTTDPVTSTFGSNLNADAVAEVETQTSGFEAEYGRAMGGIVNAITKSGGNEFEGSFRLKKVYYGWNSTSKHVGGYQKDDWWEPTITFGGPILKDRIWFFLTYKRIDRDLETEARVSKVGPEEWEYAKVDASQLWQDIFGKLTFQINPSNKLVVEYISDPAVIHGETDGTGTYSPEAMEKQEQGGDNFGVEYTHLISKDMFFNVKLGFVMSYLNIVPDDGDTETPAKYNEDDEILYDNSRYSRIQDRERYSASANYSFYIPTERGGHTFKTGIEYQHWLIKDDTYYHGGEYYRYGRNPVTGQEYPIEKIEEIGAEPVEDTANYYAFYFQDKWELREGLTLNPGIRYEYIMFKNDVGDETGTFDMMIAPRLGAAWDPTASGRSKVFGHVGRYYNPLDLQLPLFMNQKDPEYRHYSWSDQFGWVYDYSTGGEENPNSVDPDLKPEYTDEFVLGYEYEISRNVSLGVQGTLRTTRDIIEDVGIYYDADGNVIEDPYSGDLASIAYYVTNPDGARRDYKGLEFNLKAFTEKVDILASYTLSKVEGSVIGTFAGVTGAVSHFTGDYDLPGTSQNLYGPLPWDSTHYLKVLMTVHLPAGFHVGTHWFTRSGYTYSKYGYDELYGTGYSLSGKRGRYRLPTVSFIDLSLQKDFDFKRYGKLTFIIDISNVLDSQPVLAVAQNDNWAFGKPIAWASPRKVTASIYYRF